jgi:hypothetical protein
MEKKKGELLNQLAIISDLIEKLNLDSVNQTTFFEVNDTEFDRVKKLVEKKFDLGDSEDNGEGMFTITIGEINFIFSKNSA